MALGIFFFLGPNLPGMRRLILVLMLNACYLAEILIFLTVTNRYLVVTGRYHSLLLVLTFSMNAAACHCLKTHTHTHKKNWHFQIRISGIAHISTCFFYYNMYFTSWCVSKYMQPNLPMLASKKLT